MLISHKDNFRAKKTTRDRGGHYIIVKGSIHQEDIPIKNMYAPDNRDANYVEQKLTELEEIGKFTIIVGDFNTLLSIVDRTARQKINKDIKELNTTNNQ